MDIVRDQEKKGLLLEKTSPQHPHCVIIVPRAALRGVAHEKFCYTESRNWENCCVSAKRCWEWLSQVQEVVLVLFLHCWSLLLFKGSYDFPAAHQRFLPPSWAHQVPVFSSVIPAWEVTVLQKTTCPLSSLKNSFKVETENGQPLWKRMWRVFKKIKIGLHTV